MSSRRSSYALAFAFLFVASCGPKKGHGGGDDQDQVDASPLPHTLSSITVDPTNPIVELDLNTPGQQAFTATANYLDGTTEDVTSTATWTVVNPAVGAMTGATLDIPQFATASAVVSKITADADGMQGTAQITVVAYRRTGAQQDFFFVLPFQDPAGNADKPLDFATDIPGLDVAFVVDTTGSMGGEIQNMQSALTGTIIPGIEAAVTDSQFAVAAFDDFPVDSFGSPGCDQPFVLEQTVTNDNTLLNQAVGRLSSGGFPIGCGNDTPEAGFESIYQAATGEGLAGPGATSVPANHTGIGGVAFRPGKMPVIVSITDAPAHGPGETDTCFGSSVAYSADVNTAHSRQQTKDALAGICARVVGIAATNGCSPNAYLTDLSTATGARLTPAAWDVGARPAGCAANQCCTGLNGTGQAPDGDGMCPEVFNVSTDGTGVSASIVTGIQMLTRFATFDVDSLTGGGTTDIDNNPLPTPHTTADFIKAVTPTAFTLPPPPPVLPDPTFDTTTFHNVTPGTQVAFQVSAFNDFVPQTDQAQIFRATIQVLASGCTPLDQRDVLILVPPTPITIE